MAETAVIENVNIENIYIDGIGKNVYYTSSCGALAGCFSGMAKNCHILGEISAIECSGGLVGRLTDETYIENCTAYVDISGCWYTGDFLGYLDGTVKSVYLKNCASFGTVTAFIPSVYLDEIRDAGGFIGYCTDGLIENCHGASPLVVKNTALSVGSFVSQTHNAFMYDCTYAPAAAGSWDLIYWINFARCRGDDTPYTFTARSGLTRRDFVLPVTNETE